MASKGRNFGTEAKDFENLRVVGDDLYWHDKKVKIGGWTRGERISATGVFVSALVALVIAFLVYADKIETNLRSVEEQLCQTGQFQFCKSIKPKQAAPGSSAASS